MFDTFCYGFSVISNVIAIIHLWYMMTFCNDALSSMRMDNVAFHFAQNGSVLFTIRIYLWPSTTKYRHALPNDDKIKWNSFYFEIWPALFKRYQYMSTNIIARHKSTWLARIGGSWNVFATQTLLKNVYLKTCAIFFFHFNKII